MQLTKNSNILFEETNWLDDTVKKKFDEYISASGGRIKSKENLARYKIAYQVDNNFRGLARLGDLYAQSLNDPKERLDLLLRYVGGELLKQSSLVGGSDKVVKVFELFQKEPSFPGAEEADDFIKQNENFLKRIERNPKKYTKEGDENFALAAYPRTILAYLIARVIKRYGKDSNIVKSASTYETIISDFNNAVSIGLEAATDVSTGNKFAWHEAIADAMKRQRYVSSPAKFKIIEPTGGVEDEEDDEIEATPSTTAGPEPEISEPTAPKAPPRRRERKFKGSFEPGAMNLVYAMGDFWDRVKEVEGDPLYAVEVLQAAAEKLGKRDDLTNLFAIAASKLDEELPEETPTTS